MKTETAQAAYGGTTEGGPAAQLSRMAEIVHGAGAAMRGSGRREAEADTRESGRREAEADTREGGRREAEAVRRDGGARELQIQDIRRYQDVRAGEGARNIYRGSARPVQSIRRRRAKRRKACVVRTMAVLLAVSCLVLIYLMTGEIYRFTHDRGHKGVLQIMSEKAARYGHDIFLISDEPYREIVFEGVEAPYVSKFYDNTLSCYSFSKSLSRK